VSPEAPELTPRVVHFGHGRGGAPAVAVCATSAWNGLAFSAHQTWAFRRADLTAFVESPFRCANGQRATMGQIRTLPPEQHGADRLLAIGRRLLGALAPALRVLPPRGRLGLGICLPARMADGDRSSSPAFAAQRAALERGLRQELESLDVDVIAHVEPRGHAALAFAMMGASAALEQQTLDAVVLGGLDTYYDPDVVEDLIADERLFDGENLDSIIPGEGGAFLLLARRDVARSLRWPILAEVRAAATGFEPSTPFDDFPCTGVGLARAARAATEMLREARWPLGWWMADTTAESYRMHELQLAWPRAAAGLMTPASTLDFLPPHLGDLGAATLPTGVAVAIEGLQRGAPEASHCLITASSETPDRGAVLIQKA
jgi:3-oxoacyl-[acyl-carrier-protein] synthase-1